MQFKYSDDPIQIYLQGHFTYYEFVSELSDCDFFRTIVQIEVFHYYNCNFDSL